MAFVYFAIKLEYPGRASQRAQDANNVGTLAHANITFGRLPSQHWPTTQEGNAALLARMEQVEPGWLSPEDEAARRDVVRAQKEFEKIQFFADAEKQRNISE